MNCMQKNHLSYPFPLYQVEEKLLLFMLSQKGFTKLKLYISMNMIWKDLLTFLKRVKRGGDYNEWNVNPIRQDIQKLLQNSSLNYIILDYPFLIEIPN